MKKTCAIRNRDLPRQPNTDYVTPLLVFLLIGLFYLMWSVACLPSS